MAGVVLIGLSDEEIQELCKRPLLSRSKMFGAAEQWYEQNRKQLEREHPGKHLTMNAGDLSYIITESYKYGHELYRKNMGPPTRFARHMFDVDIKPR